MIDFENLPEKKQKKLLKKLKKEIKKIKRTGNRYDYTTLGWGHNIEMQETIGFATSWAFIFSRKSLQRGDEIVQKMESGKDGLFVIKEVDPVGNPHDMFKVTMIHVGYTDGEWDL